MGKPVMAPHLRADMNDHTHGPKRELGIPDLVGPDLRVLFCGINPGQRSGEVGLHFARAGNRFWKLLHAGGFTDHVFAPTEQAALPALGIGITNLVERVTVAASELDRAELRAGGLRLEAKAKGENSMSEKARYGEAVEPCARRDPDGMVKATLLECAVSRRS